MFLRKDSTYLQAHTAEDNIDIYRLLSSKNIYCTHHSSCEKKKYLSNGMSAKTVKNGLNEKSNSGLQEVSISHH
jgi:hypothetical protein